MEQEKEVQFYSAAVNAWFGTRIEHDRSLLTLAAGGIGLLLTLLSTVGVRSSEGAVLYSATLLSFLICLGSVLWIFRRNSTHLQEIIKNNVAGDAILRTLDAVAIGSFFLGAILSSIIGITVAVHSLHSSEENMSGENKSIGGLTQDSFDGVTNLRPGATDMTKSFEGATALRPAPTTPSPTQQPATLPDAPVPTSQSTTDQK